MKVPIYIPLKEQIFISIDILIFTSIFILLRREKIEILKIKNPKKQGIISLILSFIFFIFLSFEFYFRFNRGIFLVTKFDLTFFLLFIIIILIVFVKNKEPLSTIGLSLKKWRQDAILVIISIIGFVISYTIAKYFLSAKELFNVLPTKQLFNEVAYFIFYVGFIEEIFFRGYIQTRLEGLLGNKYGFILATFIYAIFHIPVGIFVKRLSIVNPQLFASFFIPPLVVGFLFGHIYQKSRSILGLTILHGINDVICFRIFMIG